MFSYFRRLLDAEDTASIKRFTVLVGLALLVLNNLYSLFMKTTHANTELIAQNSEYCFMIVAVGILGLGVEYIGKAQVAKAKAYAEAFVEQPQPEAPLTVEEVNVENIEQVNTDSVGTKPKKNGRRNIPSKIKEITSKIEGRG